MVRSEPGFLSVQARVLISVTMLLFTFEFAYPLAALVWHV